MAVSCDCDQHGSCAEYNSSRFSYNEKLYHIKWNGLYDSSIGEFRRNISVCYCDAGWTGYSDLGTFQLDVLQNCAISKSAMTGLWAISSICYAVLIVSMITRGMTIKQRDKDKGFQAEPRVFVRFVPTICFFGIAMMKLTSMDEPWFVTIGVTPGITMMYLLGMLCFMFDITETQYRQMRRYYSKMFKDFGMGDRVKVDQVHIVRSVRIQQVCTALSVTFLGVTVIRGSNEMCVAALIVYFGVVLATSLVDVLIIDPKTNSRFLVILKRMIDVNAGSAYQSGKPSIGFQSHDSTPGLVRMNSANLKANDRLQEVYAKVVAMNRSKRMQVLFFVVSYIPFYRRSWWKYLGYNIVLGTIIHSFAISMIHFLSIRRRARRRQRIAESQVTNRVKSSEVSAFQSTAVSIAPLVTITTTPLKE